MQMVEHMYLPDATGRVPPDQNEAPAQPGCGHDVEQIAWRQELDREHAVRRESTGTTDRGYVPV